MLAGGRAVGNIQRADDVGDWGVPYGMGCLAMTVNNHGICKTCKFFVLGRPGMACGSCIVDDEPDPTKEDSYSCHKHESRDSMSLPKLGGENPDAPVGHRPDPSPAPPLPCPVSTMEQYARCDVKPFVKLSELAELLALPEEWLRCAADVGRIPFIGVAGQKAFDVTAVREQLVRASQWDCDSAHDREAVRKKFEKNHSR